MTTADRFALLTGPHTCYKCGQATRVSAVGLAGFDEHDIEHGTEHVEDCVLLTQITRLNDTATQTILSRSPWLRFDHSHTASAMYLANHCEQCDALIGAWFIAQPGEAFFPLSHADVARLAVEWFDMVIEVEDIGGMQSSWIDNLLAPDQHQNPKKNGR